jgi:excisionase family DNA binding protein
MFPKLLTVQEVAKMFRMNTLTVYEYVRTGKLPAVKIGRSYRILEVDLYSFITANKTLRVNNLQAKERKVNAS